MPTLRQEYRSLYWCWKAMKQRTRNPKCRAYHNYGGRGIEMTHEWDEFEPFLEWALGSGWQKGLDIDRIDNDDPYCPENCRWITRRENTNNRRMTKHLTVNGQTNPTSYWADESGIPRHTINAWIRKHGEQYVIGRIADALEHGYKPCDYSYSHTKRVVHVDSGRVFQSVKEASETFGMSACNLSTCLNHRDGQTRFGTFAFC